MDQGPDGPTRDLSRGPGDRGGRVNREDVIGKMQEEELMGRVYMDSREGLRGSRDYIGGAASVRVFSRDALGSLRRSIYNNRLPLILAPARSRAVREGGDERGLAAFSMDFLVVFGSVLPP